MSGIFNASVFNNSVFNTGTTGQTITVICGGDGDLPSWKDYVKAVSDRHTAQYVIKEQKKELAKVERKIVASRVKVKKTEKPEGILANLWKLEERKTEIKERIYEAKQEFMQLDKFIESFIASEEIDDDDEEILFH